MVHPQERTRTNPYGWGWIEADLLEIAKREHGPNAEVRAANFKRNDSEWWWFGIFFIFPFSWEFHHPNWRTHIFQRVSNHQPVRNDGIFNGISVLWWGCDGEFKGDLTYKINWTSGIQWGVMGIKWELLRLYGRLCNVLNWGAPIVNPRWVNFTSQLEETRGEAERHFFKNHPYWTRKLKPTSRAL